ncbi:helix-turn-helix domain-containing protein [Celeribacter naphthalenivorans]|uniref:helix-turn-helix domain-containing protein n=1 Tax=Celeribacter naphthalenivorans TaxID=1614694 RepID=UPI001CFA1D45
MTDYGSQRPYTHNSLAERWDCSAQTVRNLISEGRLRAFRVGRMFRLKPEAVEEYECHTASQSENCEADSASLGKIQPPGKGDAISLRHAPERTRSRKP